MIEKEGILLLIVVTLSISVIVFSVHSSENHNKSIPPAEKLSSFFQNITITSNSFTEFTTEEVTIIVNNTTTIPVTISFDKTYAYYYNDTYTFTIDTNFMVTWDGTITTLPDVDKSIIELGPLSLLCTGNTTTIYGTDVFWPEVFLSAMGYSTAQLTGVAPCINAYLVSAGR